MKTNNVLVNNLCSWPLSFRRMAGQGDIEIPGNARNFPLLSEEEVLASSRRLMERNRAVYEELAK